MNETHTFSSSNAFKEEYNKWDVIDYFFVKYKIAAGI